MSIVKRGLTLVLKNKFRALLPLTLTSAAFVFLFTSVEIEGLSEAISRVNPRTFLVMVALFSLNIFLVSMRLQSIFSFFGNQLAFWILFRSSLSSFIGSLFLGSFFGQSMGRQVSLRNSDVSPETISAITIVERVLTVSIGGLFCLAGSLWIFNTGGLLNWVNTSDLVLSTLTIFLCLLVVLCVDASKEKFKLIRHALSFKKLLLLIKIISVSCASQFLTFFAFILISSEMAPNTDFLNLLAASAVIVFAASLPISINGWGIRELASIAVLGEIGIPTSSALIVSMGVGICANVSFALLLPCLMKNPKHILDKPIEASTPDSKRVVQSLNYFFITLTSILILAQITITPFSVPFSFNLADPFVLMYLSSVVAVAIKTKRLPSWSQPKLNLYVALFTLILIFALVKGYNAVGFTEWAFYGRALGWFVLLAYLLFGFFIINQLRHFGIVRFTEVLILSLSSIIAMYIFTNIIAKIGIISFPLTYTSHFSGLVMNRNAFAFQLLTCSALYLVLSPFLGATKTQEQGNETSNYFVPFEALHGLIILGIYLTGSRAGMLTWILVTSGFVFAGVLKPKLILRSIVYALAILLISKLGMFLLTPASLNDTNAFLEPTLSAEGSDTLRWDTIVHGIKMWADNPVFGSGLGVFFATSTSYFGKPTVIHSTPVWVLAEFGLTGFTLLAVISFGFYKSAFLSDLKKTKNACLVIIMTNFLIFGLVHEIFYQRIFWLVIGLCLAVPWSNKTPQAESQS